MKTHLILLLAGTLCYLNCSCSPTAQATETAEVAPSNTAQQRWQSHQREMRESLKATDSLTGLEVPLLKSSHFERRWQNPEKEISPDGIYKLFYSDPESSFDSLTIYGSPQPLITFDGPPPPEGGMGPATPQDWKTTEIAGKNVRYFVVSSGGNGGEIWSTEGFSLTAPDGRTGYYRLETEFNTFDAPERFSKVTL